MELPGGPRSALIIGNSEYPGFEFTSVLKSLDVIEAALEKEGFEVIRLENPYYKDLPKRIEEYAKTVPTNGTALVYYSGIAVTYKRLGKVYNALRPAKAESSAGHSLVSCARSKDESANFRPHESPLVEQFCRLKLDGAARLEVSSEGSEPGAEDAEARAVGERDGRRRKQGRHQGLH